MFYSLVGIISFLGYSWEFIFPDKLGKAVSRSKMNSGRFWVRLHYNTFSYILQYWVFLLKIGSFTLIQFLLNPSGEFWSFFHMGLHIFSLFPSTSSSFLLLKMRSFSFHLLIFVNRKTIDFFLVYFFRTDFYFAIKWSVLPSFINFVNTTYTTKSQRVQNYKSNNLEPPSIPTFSPLSRSNF